MLHLAKRLNFVNLEIAVPAFWLGHLSEAAEGVVELFVPSGVVEIAIPLYNFSVFLVDIDAVPSLSVEAHLDAHHELGSWFFHLR